MIENILISLLRVEEKGVTNVWVGGEACGFEKERLWIKSEEEDNVTCNMTAKGRHNSDVLPSVSLL